LKRNAVAERLNATNFAIHETFAACVFATVCWLLVREEALALVGLVAADVLLRRDTARLDANEDLLARGDEALNCRARLLVRILERIVDEDLRVRND
jgi:hypothetical protein